MGLCHSSLCVLLWISPFVSWGEAEASQLEKMYSHRRGSWSLSNRQVGRNENANYFRESVENESAHWASLQPLGADFFKKIMTYSRVF